jgi:hypothetical protein
MAALPFGVRQKPQLVEMPAQKMAVVRTVGDPGETSELVFKALYGATYTLKFDVCKPQGIEYSVGAPRARWPNAHLKPRNEWIAIWGIPVPDDATELPQKVPEITVALETWEYGTVAHILHLGTYAEEGPTIEKLHAFITEHGYEIAGDHEEEYLSRPGAKNMKTIVRTEVRPAAKS